MKTLSFILLVLLAFSCKTNKVANLADNTLPYLTFTSGGGFAGQYTTYVLLENGQIFEKGQFASGTEPDSKPAGTISKEQAQQIFSNYTVLDLDNVNQESYGNYTYTIIKTDGDQQHKLVWEKDKAGAEILQVFYKNAMNAIQNRTADVKAKEEDKMQ